MAKKKQNNAFISYLGPFEGDQADEASPSRGKHARGSRAATPKVGMVAGPPAASRSIATGPLVTKSHQAALDAEAAIEAQALEDLERDARGTWSPGGRSAEDARWADSGAYDDVYASAGDGYAYGGGYGDGYDYDSGYGSVEGYDDGAPGYVDFAAAGYEVDEWGNPLGTTYDDYGNAYLPDDEWGNPFGTTYDEYGNAYLPEDFGGEGGYDPVLDPDYDPLTGLSDARRKRRGLFGR
ncbi:MAG: hypothetical protein IKD70_06155, partial [Eggerthellaceae bacterium]|nr:hypothetical protein [Eggerthellaceae bacterium]